MIFNSYQHVLTCFDKEKFSSISTHCCKDNIQRFLAFDLLTKSNSSNGSTDRLLTNSYCSFCLNEFLVQMSILLDAVVKQCDHFQN